MLMTQLKQPMECMSFCSYVTFACLAFMRHIERTLRPCRCMHRSSQNHMQHHAPQYTSPYLCSTCAIEKDIRKE